MSDSETDEKVGSTKRNAARALLICCVMAAVATFTVLQYVTNESLRNSVTTQRISDYTSLSQEQLRRALCSCQEPNVPYSQFLKGQAPLANGSTGYDGTSLAIECARFISPNADADIAAHDGDVTRLAGLLNYGGLYQACVRVTHQVWEMHFGTFAADGIIFSTGNLLTQQELLDVRLKPAITSIGLRTLVQKLDNYLAQSDQMDQTSNAFDKTSPEGRIVSAQHDNALASANLIATALLGGIEHGFFHDMTNYLQNHVLFDPDGIYQQYAQKCNPLFCDISERKSVWGRMTEFLALIGGLWTLFLGVGLLLWCFIGLAVPDTVSGIP